MFQNNVWLAFLLTLFAGLSTGIGGVIALASKKTNTRFLASALGFSAGVMIYVSFVEILVKGREALIAAKGLVAGSWMAAAAFFAGMIVIGIIDHSVPEETNPHHNMACPDDIECEEPPENDHRNLARMGLMAALAIAIHNFPEGLATFASALKDPKLGIAIAVAVAIHNIPEGIAVAVPLFYATNDKRKALGYALLSGISEPLGALAGYLLLAPFFNDTVLGLLFAFVAGIMVFISLDELLPAAKEYDEEHAAIFGLVAGMAVMAISLLIFIE
ncbi:MAG: zinc transporter ZupT [Firmicutes bacterium]|nr:zinc transporter ZupT [Bacillota bacterium]